MVTMDHMTTCVRKTLFIVMNLQRTITQFWSSPKFYGALKHLLAHCLGFHSVIVMRFNVLMN